MLLLIVLLRKKSGIKPIINAIVQALQKAAWICRPTYETFSPTHMIGLRF